MAKRLPKPVRYMLFGTLGLLLALLGGLVVLALILPPEPPEPVIVNPRVWSRVAAGDRIEVNGWTFEMPIGGVYARLDGSYGPDLEGALLVRRDANFGSEIVVGQISRLTPETTIHPYRFGSAFMAFARETSERGDDLRLLRLPSQDQELLDAFPPERQRLLDRFVGLCLPADAYLFSDGIVFDLGHMTSIMGSWEPLEADAD